MAPPDSPAGAPPGDLPEASGRRLASSTWSSGLSVSDFAATQHMGMQPVGLVQGFCVMSWSWYQNSSPTSVLNMQYQPANTLTTYRCPHSMMTRSSDHPWAGFNVDLVGLAQAWGQGYAAALGRLLEEAKVLGAHGVIGVKDNSKPLIGSEVREFHLTGTAVIVEGQSPPPQIWSTYLAGARLGKLFEAGLEPESVVGSYAAIRIWPSCVTEIQEHGRYDLSGYVRPGEIDQLSDAETDVRRMVRDRVKHSLRNETALHGADLRVTNRESVITATLVGTRVRQVRSVAPLPAPRPTVSLA